MAEVDLSAVFTLVASIAADMREMKAEMREVKAEIREMKADIRDLKNDMSTVKSEIADLRDAVHQYHSAVIGHGVLIDEHDSRLIRVERQLGLPHRIG